MLENTGIRSKHNYERESPDNQIISRHGIVNGADIRPVFEDIRQFLEETEQEFLIIKVKEENNLRTEQREFFIKNLILEYLGKYLINKADTEDWFDINSVTMETIFEQAKNSKRILMIVEPTHTSFPR